MAAWRRPISRPPSFRAPDTFHLLGEERHLSAHGWNDSRLDPLWLYNLHYFDDLAAHDSAARSREQSTLIERWIAENAAGRTIGWDPYPTSLRLVNWIKWSLAGNQLPEAGLHSLAVQLRWLEKRLEHHLLGNHLLANAKGLVFGGVFFGGSEGDRWLERGMSLLEAQVPEQILSDGGHFELSPMYHALALEDMLDIQNLLGACSDASSARYKRLAAEWSARIPSMLGWLATMTHPDGEISFFNDAAMGVAPAPAEIQRYAARIGYPGIPEARERVVPLVESGYVRLETQRAVALLDVAPIGPDYIPGHAHADTLSFELSLSGRRVIVNSGTSCYGSTVERLRQRGTAAHNTVVIDGADSSEVWGGFRVARRAHPRGFAVSIGDTVRVRCAHDGYRWKAGAPVHEREWELASEMLAVRDRVSGGFESASARYHLHPDIEVSEVTADGESGGSVLLTTAGPGPVHFVVLRGKLSVEDSSWHPRFGEQARNRCLAVELDGGRADVEIRWNPNE